MAGSSNSNKTPGNKNLGIFAKIGQLKITLIWGNLINLIRTNLNNLLVKTEEIFKKPVNRDQYIDDRENHVQLYEPSPLFTKEMLQRRTGRSLADTEETDELSDMFESSDMDDYTSNIAGENLETTTVTSIVKPNILAPPAKTQSQKAKN